MTTSFQSTNPAISLHTMHASYYAPYHTKHYHYEGSAKAQLVMYMN